MNRTEKKSCSEHLGAMASVLQEMCGVLCGEGGDETEIFDMSAKRMNIASEARGVADRI